MRVIAALLIIAIICQGTFAVSSKARQSKLLIEKVNASLSKSHLGRALKGMVQIASKLGYEYQDLYDAFSALKDSLLQKLDDENSLFEEKTAYHWSAVTNLEVEIRQLEIEIDELQFVSSQNARNLEVQRELLAAAEASLAENKALKEAAEAELVEAQETYQTESDEYAEVRVVIAEAVAKLQEAQSHYDTAQLGGFSFVQLKNTFVSFAQKVKSTTEKLPAKHQLFVKPVIQAMLAIKQDAGSSSIQVAINALNSLQAYFDQALSDLTNIFVAYKASLEEAIINHAAIIEILENETIPNYTNLIREIEVFLEQLAEQIAADQISLATAQANLEEENARWVITEARHNALVDRINSEYDLVGQAERLIRTAQNNLEQ